MLEPSTKFKKHHQICIKCFWEFLQIASYVLEFFNNASSEVLLVFLVLSKNSKLLCQILLNFLLKDCLVLLELSKRFQKVTFSIFFNILNIFKVLQNYGLLLVFLKYSKTFQKHTVSWLSVVLLFTLLLKTIE